MRDRLGQVELRPRPDRGGRGRAAQGPAGLEARRSCRRRPASTGPRRASTWTGARSGSWARPEPWPRRAEPPPAGRDQRVRVRRDQRPCPDRGVGPRAGSIGRGRAEPATRPSCRADRDRRPGRALRAVRGAPGVRRAGPRRLDRGRAGRASRLVGGRGVGLVRARRARRDRPRAYRIDEVALPTDRFRIPPRELEEMLPQQSLFLRLAAEAIADAGWDDRTRLRCRVPRRARARPEHDQLPRPMVAAGQGPRVERPARPGPVGRGPRSDGSSELRESFGPALSANRTMGALGSIVASRVAREFRLGGPSFTVSAEEASGLRALDVACRMLRRGELDEAIVGAVDLPGDLRASIAEESLHPSTVLADGAAVAILKRLDDAVRDGDRIYAVVRGVGVATGGPAPDRDAYLRLGRPGLRRVGRRPVEGRPGPDGRGRTADGRAEAEALEVIAGGRAEPLALASARGDLGFAGGRVGVRLDGQGGPLPPSAGPAPAPGRTRSSSASIVAPRGPQFWLRDRDRGPRRALVAGLGIDGNVAHAVLEAPRAVRVRCARRSAPTPRPPAVRAVRRRGGRPGRDSSGGLQDLEALARSGDAADRGPGPRLVAGPTRATRPASWRSSIVADGLGPLLEGVEAARRTGRAEGAESRGRPGDRVGLLAPADRAGLGAGVRLPRDGEPLRRRWAGSSRPAGPKSSAPRIARTSGSGARWRPGTYWNVDPPGSFDDHRAPIFGQVSLGTFVADLLRSAGVTPDSAIGYSLGETTALFALHAWTDRDEMFRRFDASTAVPDRPRRPLRRRPARLGTRRGRAGRLGRRDPPAPGRRVRAGPRVDPPGLPPDRQHRRRGGRRRPGGRGPPAGRGRRRPVPPAPAGQHRPLRGRPRGRAGLPRPAPPADLATARGPVLQRGERPVLSGRSRVGRRLDPVARPRTGSTSRPSSGGPTTTASAPSSRSAPAAPAPG